MANTLNASINLTTLDFATLREAFKSYLRDQSAFQDYDFEGSNMGVLLDLLAYNTFKNGFYLNMAVSEGFIDSAQLRPSLFSHAKELNYLPRSSRSAVANVTVSFTATGESQPYVLPKGSQFSALIKNNSYTFSTPESIVISSANTTFEFTTDIYEGPYRKDTYTFLDNVDNQRFQISNKNVDTRSIAVTVLEDSDAVGDTYTYSRTLLDLNESSKVFFLQTNEFGFYEVLFGDNNLGRQPKINSIIILDYRISQGLQGNGAREFFADFEPTSLGEATSDPVITVNEIAANGDDEETIESIRYYAPRHFQVQERTVTTTDYEVALKAQFPEINAVSVFGGEEADPPQFGRIFVSIDISNVDGLPESKKDEYYNFLKRRSALSLDPIFIEPEFLYLQTNALVRYNVNITTNSSNRIKTLVTNAILGYNEDNLNDFNSTLRFSQLSNIIDESDTSIVSNITTLKMYKKLQPDLDTNQNLDVDFGIALTSDVPDQISKYPTADISTVTSSTFRYNGIVCSLKDDSNGVMNIVKKDGAFDVVVVAVGTVDYDSGAIKLNNFKIDSYDGAALKIYGVPADIDVSCSKNTILTMEADEVLVTVSSLRL